MIGISEFYIGRIIMKFKALAAISAIAAAAVVTTTASADFLIPTGATTTTAVADVFDPETNEAWLKIWNQWNETSMFTIDEVNEDTKDIIISFDVEGCDGSYQAKTGFGINGWTPSIWGAADYDVIGGVPTYTIDHDGSYEMIVPFYLFMQTTGFEDEDTGEEVYKEYLESVDCLELCIGGLSATSTMVVTINDVTQSSVAHSLSECELVGTAAAAPAPAPADTDSNAAPAANAAPASTGADKGSPDTGVEGVAGLLGAGLVSAAVLVAAGKKRK